MIEKKSGGRAKSMARPVASGGSKKYDCDIDGPILVTAAHSTKIIRGKGIKGKRVRRHLREKWVSNIAIGLANRLSALAKDDPEMTYKFRNYGSFFIWNKDKPYNEVDMDPNYLTKSMFTKSCFHLGLEKWL